MSGEAQITTLTGLLDRLEPMADPPAVPMIPQTAGWAGLAALLAVLGLWLAYRVIKRRRAEAYRRAALRELDMAAHDPAAVAGLLRRTALCAYPRRDVAALQGPEWISFLRDTAEIKQLPDVLAERLTSAPYQRPAGPEPDLSDFARHWIKTHRKPQC